MPSASGVLSPPTNLVEGIVSGCLLLGDGQDRLKDVGWRPVLALQSPMDGGQGLNDGMAS